MKQIKFRAWMIDEMLYDTPVVSFDGVNFSTLRKTGEYDFELSRRCTAVMQYTGLKDYHGNEIYDGDIVKDRFGRIMQVQWWNYRLCWVAITETYFHHADLYDWVYRDNDNDELTDIAKVEILGNIYEHPELYKSTQNENIKPDTN